MINSQKILLAFIFFIVSYFSYAQKTFVEFIGESDKVFFDGVFANSELKKNLKNEIKSGSVTEQNLKPKKIGLLTVYLFEENYRKRKAHLTFIYSREGELNYFFNRVSERALEGLNKGFGSSGYELVSGNELIDTEEKKLAFEEAQSNINGLSDPFLQTLETYEMTPSSASSPFVYSFIEDGTNGYVADELATLAQKLGVDALLTVQLSTLYQTATISFSSVNFILHGINPAAPEGEQGCVLSTYSLYPDYPYPFVSVRNAKTSSERFGAYNRLLERTTKDYLKFTSETLSDLF